MSRRLLRLVFLMFVGWVATWSAPAAAAEESTTIYRDEFGVPHIFAPTLNDAAYAVGYAQAEDRLVELLKNYRRADRHDG